MLPVQRKLVYTLHALHAVFEWFRQNELKCPTALESLLSLAGCQGHQEPSARWQCRAGQCLSIIQSRRLLEPGVIGQVAQSIQRLTG